MFTLAMLAVIGIISSYLNFRFWANLSELVG